MKPCLLTLVTLNVSIDIASLISEKYRISPQQGGPAVAISHSTVIAQSMQRPHSIYSRVCHFAPEYIYIVPIFRQLARLNLAPLDFAQHISKTLQWYPHVASLAYPTFPERSQYQINRSPISYSQLLTSVTYPQYPIKAGNATT